MCNRMMNNCKLSIEHREIRAGIWPAALHKEHAYAPRRRKKPALICAQFMGDMGQVHTVLRAHIFDIMRLCPWHTFLVLTKWPEHITEDVPDNCYLGTTGTNQTTATERLKNLAHCKAKNIWFSAEPMLGDMRIGAFIRELRFVACGPETGARARAFIGEGDAISDLEGQCKAAGVPFYDKREPIHCGLLDFKPVREWPEEWKK
jgi:protein gp37